MARTESLLEALPLEVRLPIYEPFLPGFSRNTDSWRFNQQPTRNKLAIMRVSQKLYYEFRDAFWRNMDLQITVTGRSMTSSGQIRPGIVTVWAGGILLKPHKNATEDQSLWGFSGTRLEGRRPPLNASLESQTTSRSQDTPTTTDQSQDKTPVERVGDGSLSQYSALVAHIFENIHIKHVMIRVDISSDIDYRRLHSPDSQISQSIKEGNYEEYAMIDIKRRVALLTSMLRTANRIQSLNIGVLSSSLRPVQVFERFIDLLSLFKDIDSIEKAEIMPFWPTDFFNDRTDDCKRLKERKEEVGDQSGVEGFMIMEDGKPPSTKERLGRVSRASVITPVNGEKYWKYPYVWKLADEQPDGS